MHIIDRFNKWLVGEYDPIADKTDLEKAQGEFREAKEDLWNALLDAFTERVPGWLKKTYGIQK